MASEFELGFAKDAGHKRKDKPNQDDVLVIPGDLSSRRPGLLLVVDGMGGYEGGAIASSLVKGSITDQYRNSTDFSNGETLLKAWITQAHTALRDRAEGNPDLGSMGCAIVMALLYSGEVYVANVGDSRAYSFSTKEIRQLSFDHSEVADMMRAGRLTPIEALRHPRRNRLTRSLSARRKDVVPFVARYELAEDDVILLCSDGLWGVVSEVILQAVALEIRPQEACEKLIVLARNFGGPDNISVVVARKKNTPLQSMLAGESDETNPGK